MNERATAHTPGRVPLAREHGGRAAAPGEAPVITTTCSGSGLVII